MHIIADKPAQAAAWRGLAVVVDVLRCSTTICALVKNGRKDIRICANRKLAAAVSAGGKDADIFSELEFSPPGKKFDNSPHLALSAAFNPDKPVIVVTGSGAPAIMSLLRAKEIIIGCFANFSALVRYLKQSAGADLMIIPACIYLDPAHVEDKICSQAIADAISGPDASLEAAGRIHSTGRPMDFLLTRPETGKQDLEIALTPNTVFAVPQVKIKGVWGRVEKILL